MPVPANFSTHKVIDIIRSGFTKLASTSNIEFPEYFLNQFLLVTMQ